MLSQLLGISQGALTITKGHTSRNKTVAVDGLSQEELLKRLLDKGLSLFPLPAATPVENTKYSSPNGAEDCCPDSCCC